MNQSCPIWMSHVAYRNQSCHIQISHVTYEWAMSRIIQSSPVQLFHFTNEWAMSRMNQSCLIWISHVRVAPLRMGFGNASGTSISVIWCLSAASAAKCSFARTKSCPWTLFSRKQRCHTSGPAMSHKNQCVPYEWVISQIWTRLVTYESVLSHTQESCHIS